MIWTADVCVPLLSVDPLLFFFLLPLPLFAFYWLLLIQDVKVRMKEHLENLQKAAKVNAEALWAIEQVLVELPQELLVLVYEP